MNLGTNYYRSRVLVTLHDEQGGDLGEFTNRELADVSRNQHRTQANRRCAVRLVVSVGYWHILLTINPWTPDAVFVTIVVRKNGENDPVKRASTCAAIPYTVPSTARSASTATTTSCGQTARPSKSFIPTTPATVDYTRYGINDAVLVDNTGRWRDREDLEQHLKSTGVSKVLLTAPGKGCEEHRVRHQPRCH